jgi:hypothetical protein
MKFSYIIAAAGLIANLAHAGTIIEATTQDQRQTIRVEGNRVRIDSGAQKSYVIFDRDTQRAMVVDPQKRSAMQLDTQQVAAFQASQDGKAPTFTLTPDGDGPTVAGYATQKHQLTVDNKPCGTLFIAPEAKKSADIETLFSIGRDVGKPTQLANTGCDAYSPMLQDKMSALGFPVKRTNAAGATLYEINSIKESAIPSSEFAIPEGFQVVDTQALMQQALKNFASPDGKMNPEMLKKLQAQQQQLMEQLKKAEKP